MKKTKTPSSGTLKWKIATGVSAALFAVTMIGGPIANSYASIINMVLGTESTKTIGDPGKIYFEPDFATSAEQAASAEALCEEIVANGSTLLLNRNQALPLSSGAKVTLFGTTSADFIYGGTGSGGMDTSKATNLKQALEADGFTVNPTMWDFYTTGAGKDYGLVTASGSLNNYIFNNAEFLVNEVPQSAYTDTEWNSVAEYGDAAIVVLGRICGEGADLPWYGAGDGNGNLLELSTEEIALFEALSAQKSQGKIQKIIVLLNATNPIELDFLEPSICGTDYGIDACLWVGEVGQTGINAIGEILNGTTNPSGRLVDTYCFDNLTSPALQNAHATPYTNAAAAGLSFTAGNNEHYVVYQEGIYVGYRYYETRYEDMVLGNANVGNFDYSSTVAYPFGYGLSYTQFSYGPLSMEDKGDSFEFTVDVTNTGSVDGQEAVLLYMQSPYTEYDRANGIEKAAIELVGYTKLSIPAGETKTAVVTVAKSEMRAYDTNGEGTYIVDAGNYYFSTGNGAHEALNNILAKKDQLQDTSNGTVNLSLISGNYNPDLAVQYVQEQQDNSTYSVASTGQPITNQLNHGDLNRFDQDTSNDVVYLTRSNWEGTMPQATITKDSYQAAVQLAANDTMIAALTSTISSSEAELPDTMPVMGAENGLNLAQFVGVGLDETVTVEDNTFTWEDLLDQVKFAEMSKLIGQAYHSTAPVASVNKPVTKDENGPQGITATLTGGSSSTSYTSADLRAATFDDAITFAVGKSMGNDCLLANGKAYSGIYGLGVNIHRTPYSGRNFEYYSEDPFISGMACAQEVAGIQSKGVYVYMKHFALNDQETARDGISVWTNEQAAREIYLQAFEYPIQEADAMCVMTSFNRIGCIWAGGDRNLLTNILRGEWGMKGFALTDFSNSNSYMDVVQGLLAGGDAWDCNDANKWTPILNENKDNAPLVNAMRQATQRILYTVANSNAMNGVSPNMQVVEVITWWQIAFIACDVVFGALLITSIVMLVRTSRKNRSSAAS